MQRRFIVLGQKARGSGDFLLVDIPSTSGRLDVLVHALRAALLLSHGVRKDVVVYLVLLGDPGAPRSLRIDGAAARYLRPDERSLATTLQKALREPSAGSGFVEVKTGIHVANGGLEAVFAELDPAPLFVLEPAGTDVRMLELPAKATFVLGDHLGIDVAQRAHLSERGAQAVSIGPRPVHTVDAVAVLSNELDRREPVA